MSIARHGRGVRAAARAFASQIHPVFMLPPLAASWFGTLLAGQFSLLTGALHMLAIFGAVYTAHVKDGYIDFHVRDEDDDHPLTQLGCQVALMAAGLLVAAALIGLYIVAGPGAVALTFPGWAIGFLHAPQLDTNPVTTTTGYPTGIGLAVLGGYYTQTMALAAEPLAVAAVMVVLLSGVKVIDDAQDYEYDRGIAKRTVAVALGMRRARLVAFTLMALGLLGVLLAAGIGVLPASSVFAVLAFAGVAVLARRADPELATMLLIRGSYLFLAALVIAVWFEPLA
ncbi:MAG: UbiA family prenyltransferase [Halobacteriales archaeon]